MEISLSNWLRNVVAPALVMGASVFGGDVPLRDRLTPSQIEAFTQAHPYAASCLDTVRIPRRASVVDGDTRNDLQSCINSQLVQQHESMRRIWGVR